MKSSNKRPSQGVIDMMNGGYEKIQDENMKSFSHEPENIPKKIISAKEVLDKYDWDILVKLEPKLAQYTSLILSAMNEYVEIVKKQISQ